MKQLLLALGLLFSSSLLAQSPYLIKDISQGGVPSFPRSLVTIGPTTYFYADDGIHGRELWRTDGTENGTYLVKDINPGQAHSFFDDQHEQFNVLIPANERLFMVVDDGAHSYELWVSDGTEMGTKLVKDIHPDGVGVGGTSDFAVLNGKLFFTARTPSNQLPELWVTDGTEAGTYAAEGANAAQEGSKDPEMLTAHDGKLYFKAHNQDSQNAQLWVYDGVSTSVVYDIEPDQMVTSGSTLFFVADDGTHGKELWQTDGTTSGTTLVKDIYQGPESYVGPFQLTDVAGTLYFVHQNDQIWKSNGTEDGTVMVKNLHLTGNFDYFLSDFVSVDHTLYFVQGSPYDQSYIWKSDGTEAGTIKVDENSSYFEITQLTAIGSTLYFTDWDGLWKSDGTAKGTTFVKEVRQDYLYHYRLGYNDDNLLFAATDEAHAIELWISDGTEAGTHVLKDINERQAGSSFTPFVVNGNQVAFGAGHYQKQLWLTNGKQASAVNSPLSISKHDWANLVSMNGVLFLPATNHASNRPSELYKIAPGEDTLTLVKDINGEDGSYPESLTEVDGSLFFVAKDGDSHALWKSNGTEGGTIRIKEITPTRIRWPHFHDYRSVGKKLFFVADDDEHGDELWVSDGTEAGTHMVKEMNSGTDQYGKASSHPGYLTEFQNMVFFQAFDGTHHELWKSDGTEEGTVKLTSSDVNPEQLVVMGDRLFFIGHNDKEQATIWQSDGTEAGTKIMFSKDELVTRAGFVKAHPTLLYYNHLTVGDSLLYFTINDGEHGRELWKSDGTAAGTQLVKDINPQQGSSSPKNLYYTNGLLYFSADDGAHGRELWVTDGTAEGTQLVSDIYSGWLDSNPGGMVILGDLLIFYATNHLGQELWVYDILKAKLSKLSQTITFASPINHFVGDTITLVATASSGLPVSFLAEGPATLSGDVLALTGEGEVVVMASQAGNGKYDPAEVVVHRFQVASAVAEEPATEKVVTGINAAEAKTSVTVYPNPTKGRFMLKFDDAAAAGSFVCVTTATGNQVFQTRMDAAQSTIDLSPYPAGLYIITVKKGQQVRTLKVAKQ